MVAFYFSGPAAKMVQAFSRRQENGRDVGLLGL